MAHRLIRFLQIGGRFGIPFFFMTLFGFNAYHYFRPWPVADSLIPAHAGQIRLLVGGGYSSRSTYDSPGTVSERTGDYIYYPDVFKTHEMYRLSQKNDEAPTACVDSFGAISYIVGLLVVAALSVAAWWWPLVKRG